MSRSQTSQISVIVPFKDKAKMTLAAINSLIKYGPEVGEIILLSNNSSDEELAAINAGIAPIKHARVLEYNHPFNYQKLNNWGVKQSTGKYILFLNNDTEFTPSSKGVLERMLEKSAEPDVGMTGCLLLYGDERIIQHAGVYIRPGLLGDHLYVSKPYKRALEQAGTDKFPYDIRESRPLTAVTGAVQLVARQKFDAVGGFDEHFIIGGGDVDLCIRLNRAGYQTWYVAGGYIVHKESQSRAYKPVPYTDFYYSYRSYIQAYDLENGDPFLPKITKGMR